MIGLLKTKLALLIHTKVGAAIVAAALVAGGGSAVAAASTHGHLNEIGSALVAAASGTHTTTGGDASSGDSASHESAEGTLTAYTAPSGSTAGSITVQPSKGGAVSFAVTSATKVNGEHANALSDLTAAIGHKVQVQAEKSGSAWLASKVTVAAAQPTAHANDSGEGQSEQQVSGKVKSVSGSSFVVTTTNGDVTVTVDGATHFSGHVASASDLKQGMSVEVHGAKQTDGTVLASSVAAQSGESDSGDGSGAGGGGHEATPSASPAATGSRD